MSSAKWRQFCLGFWMCLTSNRYDNVWSLLWRHDGPDGVSNHQPHHCLLNRSFRRKSKKLSKMSPFDKAIMWLFESLMLSDGHSWYHPSHSITLCRPATNSTTTWVQMSWILLRCPRCNRNTPYLKRKHYICASNVDQCTIFKTETAYL